MNNADFWKEKYHYDITQAVQRFQPLEIKLRELENGLWEFFLEGARIVLDSESREITINNLDLQHYRILDLLRVPRDKLYIRITQDGWLLHYMSRDLVVAVYDDDDGEDYVVGIRNADTGVDIHDVVKPFSLTSSVKIRDFRESEQYFYLPHEDLQRICQLLGKTDWL